MLPHGGTLALTAVYDNLAGTICSLDVVPFGTGGMMCGCNPGVDGTGTDAKDGSENADYLQDEFDTSCSCCSYDGLLIGFAGHPRLSVVYPSIPMVGGYRSSSTSAEGDEIQAENHDDNEQNKKDISSGRKGFNYGVGQGGVLLASSIIDLTPALIEKSMGGTSFLEQDIIVSVSTTGTIANGVDVSRGNKVLSNDDPCVSVVLGGGVSIASFTLIKASRPEEGNPSSSSWWRIASEPYILPLPHLASKIRSDFGGTNLSSSTAPIARNKNQPLAVGHSGSVGHGLGEVLDVVFLSGYIEPTLLVLHSNPKRGGGRQWAGRMGRTEEIPVVSDESEKKDYGDDDMEMEEEMSSPETMATGTKYGLTLTAVSLAIHQHRSVVLWSLTDAIPADAWKLIAHPCNGVIVLGVNTILYVSMGGKIQSALAVNGFAKVGCPIGLIPPSKTSSMVRSANSVHIEGNPSPLPLLALQLDGARAAFVSENVALVCLSNGSLHSLQLHIGGVRTFMSLSPAGNRVGGLGVASCLSVLAMRYHASSIDRYLKNNLLGSSGGVGTKKEEDVLTDANEQTPLFAGLVSKGLIFVGSRMGDCTLLTFALNKPTRLVVTDVDAVENENGKRKLEGANPDGASSISQAAIKHLKTEVSTVDIVETPGGEQTLSREDILRLEEEELYRDDTTGVDTTAPSIVSPSRTDEESEGKDHIGTSLSTERKTVHSLTTFRTITALDSLTGLGPLGPGCYGPVATFPNSTGKDDATVTPSSESSLFSNTFASSARHMIMPCGFGDSGGLAILTTPGRDTEGGTILCEADLLGMGGAIFSLPQSNLVLLTKSDGVGTIILRGLVRMPDKQGSRPIEEFEELNARALSHNSNEEDAMDVDSVPSLHNVEDVLSKMSILSVSEIEKGNPFSVFFVKTPQADGVSYSIVIIKSDVAKESDNEEEKVAKLSVHYVHQIPVNALLDGERSRSLLSVTSMVCESCHVGMDSSISFGCVWSSGHASVFNVKTKNMNDADEVGFDVTESVIAGDSHSSVEKSEDEDFFKSDKIVAMDLVSLPEHIFAHHETGAPSELVVASDDSATLSFPPDRLSMHGSWISQSEGNSSVSVYETLIVICRRSGSLEVYNKGDVLKLSQIEYGSCDKNAVPIWRAEGCGHGVSVLGQPRNGQKYRNPTGHDVEAAEIRFFVTGPSLKEKLGHDASEKDAWMLRSLCILVDTSLGDLHLYSGSKSQSTGNRLEFSRVPLSCSTRPSEEAGRHSTKLRRKGIVSESVESDYRPNRLHRFCDISLQDGLFAATSRPLWFVSERGAPAVVSHKSRHVSAAGARQVPVSGFCSTMPAIFQVRLEIYFRMKFQHQNANS